MDDKRLDNLREDLQETREIVERNHEMLESIQTTMFWRKVSSVVYWLLIIGVAVGLFYFLDPYLDRLFDAYSQIVEKLNSVPGVGGEEGGS
ncbi:MAG: hypothetical protein BRC25_01095 [Parcubacteria group bacterium SW_6_46_9]|nr:MAG: hypothetical protein BRC25_01095 [Parcubacteria group bacterium SW_6_46_9]